VKKKGRPKENGVPGLLQSTSLFGMLTSPIERDKKRRKQEQTIKPIAIGDHPLEELNSLKRENGRITGKIIEKKSRPLNKNVGY